MGTRNFAKLSKLLQNLHSLIHSLWTCWITFVFMSMLKSHSHSFSISHSFNFSFAHSRLAEPLLFSSLSWKVTVYCRQWQCLFFDSIHTISCKFRVHRAGSQLKNWRFFQPSFRLQSLGNRLSESLEICCASCPNYGPLSIKISIDLDKLFPSYCRWKFELISQGIVNKVNINCQYFRANFRLQ